MATTWERLLYLDSAEETGAYSNTGRNSASDLGREILPGRGGGITLFFVQTKTALAVRENPSHSYAGTQGV